MILRPETHSVFAYTAPANRVERCALQKAGFDEVGGLPACYDQIELASKDIVFYVRHKKE